MLGVMNTLGDLGSSNKSLSFEGRRDVGNAENADLCGKPGTTAGNGAIAKVKRQIVG